VSERRIQWGAHWIEEARPEPVPITAASRRRYFSYVGHLRLRNKREVIARTSLPALNL
jgi:hypothetical protein